MNFLDSANFVFYEQWFELQILFWCLRSNPFFLSKVFWERVIFLMKKFRRYKKSFLSYLIFWGQHRICFILLTFWHHILSKENVKIQTWLCINFGKTRSRFWLFVIFLWNMKMKLFGKYSSSIFLLEIIFIHQQIE